jgi:hypothetical protein
VLWDGTEETKACSVAKPKKEQKGSHVTPEYLTEMTDAGASEPFDSKANELSPDDSHSLMRGDSHQVAQRGFGQAFGLHPISALATLSVNTMMFAGQVATMGALFPAALAAAVVLAVITYRAQKKFYGDDHDAALTKSLVVLLLTAIPIGLPAFLTVPSAAVGLVHMLRRKAD